LSFNFARNLLEADPGMHGGTRGLILYGCVIASLAILAGIVWSRWPLSMIRLRILESTIFGIVAVFIAWLQFEFCHNGILSAMVVPGGEAKAFRLLGNINAFRWFILIVLYGTFIPNTWRRCAAVVGTMALAPLVLTIIGSALDSSSQGFLR